MRRLIRLAPLLFTTVFTCESQVEPAPHEAPEGEAAPAPTLRWQTMLYDARGSNLAIGADMAIYVSGWSEWQETDFRREIFAKLDPHGNVEWTRERTFDRVEVAVDGFFVADQGSVRKLDVAGAETWSVQLVSPSALVPLPGGGVVVTGTSHTFNKAWALHLAGDSSLIWTREFGESNTYGNAITCAAVGPADSVVLGGAAGTESKSRSYAWVALDDLPTGETRWERFVSQGTASDQVRSVSTTIDGTVMATGQPDTVVARWTPTGTALGPWVDLPAVIAPEHAVFFPDGGLAIGESRGSTFGCVPGQNHSSCPGTIRVARMNADQTLRWFENRNDCREVEDIAVLPDGGVVVLANCDEPDLRVAGVFVFEP